MDTIKWKNEKQILIITAYRVCKAGANIGPHIAHMQQVKHLLLKGVVIPNPRWETIQDLKKIIMEHHSKGGGVVLMIDANEDWEKEMQG